MTNFQSRLRSVVEQGHNCATVNATGCGFDYHTRTVASFALARNASISGEVTCLGSQIPSFYPATLQDTA